MGGQRGHNVEEKKADFYRENVPQGEGHCNLSPVTFDLRPRPKFVFIGTWILRKRWEKKKKKSGFSHLTYIWFQEKSKSLDYFQLEKQV